jgi:hypothetical protein
VLYSKHDVLDKAKPAARAASDRESSPDVVKVGYKMEERIGERFSAPALSGLTDAAGLYAP